MLPTPYDRTVSVDADARARRLLVPKDRTTSQVRFNIGRVWRKDVDDVLIALTLAARIPHGTIIVIFGDDVKRFRRAKPTSGTTGV
jgi:hypothetical protein